MIRVALIAPSPALRAGLRSLLSSDRELVIVAEGAQWLDDEEMQSEVDVAVTTSTSLDSGDPAIPTLFLRDEPLGVQPSDDFPAVWGVLPQDTSANELCAAVRALAQGLIVGTRQLLFEPGNGSTDRSPLTEREAEVLGWLAKGLANKQIAAELGISEHTVKFHISSIYTKLNATNRTQAVREGLRNGWILL